MDEKGQQKAADHREHANKYRDTKYPAMAAPKVTEPAAPGNEYPKSVTCHDGVKRIAHNAEHEAALTKAPEPDVHPDVHSHLTLVDTSLPGVPEKEGE